MLLITGHQLSLDLLLLGLEHGRLVLLVLLGM